MIAIYEAEDNDPVMGRGTQWWVITDHNPSDIDSGTVVARVKEKRHALALASSISEDIYDNLITE